MNRVITKEMREAAWEDFLEFYDAGLIRHANSTSGEDIILELLSNAHGRCEPYYLDANQLMELFDNLWHWDCELLLKDKRIACEGYLEYKKSMAQLNRLTK